ncbi:hypothetical protein CGUA_09190 [Corynebacterium guangdongense]|nr:hypothetical protein CGUA_09190 [Corynebacterium guangdongense]
MSRAMRRVLRTVEIMFIGALLAAALFLVVIANPPKTDPQAADVVVVIAGASDGRHDIGANLIHSGVSDSLVVSNPHGPRDRIGYRLCHGEGVPEGTGTWCLNPVPSSTTGEAQTFQTLADEQGWESAVLVTSRLHHRRVALNFNRCTDVAVQVVHVPNLTRDHFARLALWEAGGYLKFFATNPC